jgi:hypothetical protein
MSQKISAKQTSAVSATPNTKMTILTGSPRIKADLRGIQDLTGSLKTEKTKGLQVLGSNPRIRVQIFATPTFSQGIVALLA